jgi:hypothetical protein
MIIHEGLEYLTHTATLIQRGSLFPGCISSVTCSNFVLLQYLLDVSHVQDKVCVPCIVSFNLF